MSRLTTQSCQPETDACDDGDGGEEVSCKAVVARGDAAPVFHAAEHALDNVAATVGLEVQRIRVAARTAGENDHFGALSFQALPEMVSVIGLIGQQATRRRRILEQGSGNADVGDVAKCQDEGERLALSVGQSMDLAGPPAT